MKIKQPLVSSWVKDEAKWHTEWEQINGAQPNKPSKLNTPRFWRWCTSGFLKWWVMRPSESWSCAGMSKSAWRDNLCINLWVTANLCESVPCSLIPGQTEFEIHFNDIDINLGFGFSALQFTNLSRQLLSSTFLSYIKWWILDSPFFPFFPPPLSPLSSKSVLAVVNCIRPFPKDIASSPDSRTPHQMLLRLFSPLPHSIARLVVLLTSLRGGLNSGMVFEAKGKPTQAFLPSFCDHSFLPSIFPPCHWKLRWFPHGHRTQ